MIHEYAVDPALLDTWDRVRYYLDKFGVDAGRLLAQYPGDRLWAAAVLELFPKQKDGPTDSARKNVEGRLERLIKGRGVFAAGRGTVYWLRGRPWSENAEQEHRNREFRAILTGQNEAQRPHVLVGHDLDESDPPALWRVQRTRWVPRRAADMAAELIPLFSLARTVLFVDRNFDLETDRYRHTLAAFLEKLWRECPNQMQLRVEYHTGDANRPNEQNNRRLLPAARFAQLCQDQLAGLIPAGLKVRFKRWDYRQLHDRYIVTDLAGVEFGQGLDDDGAVVKQNVKMTLLDTATAGRLRAEYLDRPIYTPDPGGEVLVTGRRAV